MSGTYPKGNSQSGGRPGKGGGGAVARRRRQARTGRMSLRRGIAGLVMCACIATFCLAAESNDSDRTKASKEKSGSRYTGGSRFSGGLIDPMNPNGYMKNLAGRLNTTGGANRLLSSARPSGSAATMRSSRPQGFTGLRSSGPVTRNLGTFRSLGGGQAPARAAPSTSPPRPATTNLNRYRALGGSSSTSTSRRTDDRVAAQPEADGYTAAGRQPAGAATTRREPLPAAAEAPAPAAPTPIRRVPSSLDNRFALQRNVSGYRVLGNPNRRRAPAAPEPQPAPPADQPRVARQPAQERSDTSRRVSPPTERTAAEYSSLVEAAPRAAPREAKPQPATSRRATGEIAAPRTTVTANEPLPTRERLTESSAPPTTPAERAPRVPEPQPSTALRAPVADTENTSAARRDMDRYKALLNAIAKPAAESASEPPVAAVDANEYAPPEQPGPTPAVAAEREPAPRPRVAEAPGPLTGKPEGSAAVAARPRSPMDRTMDRYRALYERASKRAVTATEEESSPLKQDLERYRAEVEASPERPTARTDELWDSMLDPDRFRDRPERPKVRRRTPAEPWSLAADLDKYRGHAVREGSRDSVESLGMALERAGLTLEDGVNVFTLGYASERGEPFRGNDGKGPLYEPGRVPQQAGETIVSAGSGVYSLLDLIVFDALDDIEANVYVDNNPLVRPFIYTGRTIGGAWKTTEEIGNAITWGYFDNVTGTVGMCIEDILELLKHTGEAATNLVRGPIHLIAGKNDNTDEFLDWFLLVPPEFVSNVFEMKGVVNMYDYEAAFAEKGVIGSVLELGGSAWLTYEALDELWDELDDDDGHDYGSSESSGGGSEPTNPPNEPPAPTPPPSPDFTIIIYPDGTIWTSG